MSLSFNKCKAEKAGDKPKRLAAGGGLYLEVMPNGSKFWRQKYRFGGKEKRLTHGRFPLIKPKEAEELRDAAKKLLLENKDPGVVKQTEKVKRRYSSDHSFEAIAREWHQDKAPEWTKKYATTIINRMEADIFPVIGKVPMEELTPRMVLDMLKGIEARGAYEVTRRVKQYCSQVLCYAVASGRAYRDFTPELAKQLRSRPVKHHAAIDPRELPALLHALESNDARMFRPTRLAVDLMLLTFVRTSELIKMRWEEIDWDDRMWIVPAERMKMKKPHLVPLSKQSLAILEELKLHNGHREWVFASHVKPRQPMSNNTILSALYRMGYKGKMTGHGFRALALTMLQEKLSYPFEVADAQLAHSKKHALGEAYDRAKFLQQRKKMMQHWSDFIESQRVAAVSDKKLRLYRINV